jgi:fatty-acyl-CoA synthase
VPDELYAEVGHAFVMLKPGKETTLSDLRDYCRTQLVNFKIPKRFDIRPHLPLLANGKVDKMSLKRELATARQG